MYLGVSIIVCASVSSLVVVLTEILVRHFRGRAQLRNDSELNANCIAALIIYIKFQTPVRQMRIILALQRWLVGKRKSADGAKIASQIPKDIHTILTHYNLDPHNPHVHMLLQVLRYSTNDQ